jgi:hypothetical protein
MHNGSYQRLPKLFQVFGCWSECEMYKVYFFQQPDVITNLIKLVETERITIQMFEYITKLLKKVSKFNISDQNSDKYNLKDRIGQYLDGEKAESSKNILTSHENELSFRLLNP